MYLLGKTPYCSAQGFLYTFIGVGYRCTPLLHVSIILLSVIVVLPNTYRLSFHCGLLLLWFNFARWIFSNPCCFLVIAYL